MKTVSIASRRPSGFPLAWVLIPLAILFAPVVICLPALFYRPAPEARIVWRSFEPQGAYGTLTNLTDRPLRYVTVHVIQIRLPGVVNMRTEEFARFTGFGDSENCMEEPHVQPADRLLEPGQSVEIMVPTDHTGPLEWVSIAATVRDDHGLVVTEQVYGNLTHIN